MLIELFFCKPPGGASLCCDSNLTQCGEKISSPFFLVLNSEYHSSGVSVFCSWNEFGVWLFFSSLLVCFGLSGCFQCLHVCSLTAAPHTLLIHLPIRPDAVTT